MAGTKRRGMGALALALVAILAVCPLTAVADEAEVVSPGPLEAQAAELAPEEAVPEGAVPEGGAPDGAEAAAPAGVPLGEGAGVYGAPLGAVPEGEAAEPLGASVEYSGTWGTCSWTIDSEGLLSVFPTDGASGQLADSRGYNSTSSQAYFPWYQYCSSIKAVSLAEGVALPENCEGMFRGCSSLASLDVSGWDTSKVTDMYGMFKDCSSLASLDVSGWDTSSVEDMRGMFEGCESLTSLDVSGWDTSSVIYMGYKGDRYGYSSGYGMFEGCESLTSLDVSGWDTSSVIYMGSMFWNCPSLASLDVSGWDTSSVESMILLFCGCSSLETLDVSGWDTSSVTDMRSMFCGCSSLASLDVSGWDTSKVTDMDSMFERCSSLASLDASGWDTSSVEDMKEMFDGCSSLAYLDLSGWDTSSVEDMWCMFDGCSSLASLDLSGWDTSSVTRMYCMFYGCSSLASLDASGWDTSKVTDMCSMLRDCTSLVTVVVGPRWSTNKVHSSGYMFLGCTHLVGGNGTTYDPAHTNKEYARADEPGNPGYLTAAGGSSELLTIRSDYKDDRTFTFRRGESVEGLVGEQPGLSYNPRLAHLACVLARAAYTESLMEQDLLAMGYGSVRSNDTYGDFRVSYFTADKELGDGGLLVTVVIQGTDFTDGNNAANNLGLNPNTINPLASDFEHEGFVGGAEAILGDLRSHYPSIAENATVLITGHSQGAAVGNQLARLLIDSGVPVDRVCAYNFACPNVAVHGDVRDFSPASNHHETGQAPGSGTYDGIYNIGNEKDLVTYVPGNAVYLNKLLGNGHWGKYGTSFWFAPDKDGGPVFNHDMVNYVDEMAKELPIGHYKALVYSTDVELPAIPMAGFTGRCPVDLFVYDAGGQLVASVEGDRVTFVAPGRDDVLAVLDGDEKMVVLRCDQRYDVRLGATGDGEMTYEVTYFDIANDRVLGQREFASVVLEDGKEFASSAGGYVGAEQVRLVTLDGSGEPLREVLADGAEAALPEYGPATVGYAGPARDGSAAVELALALPEGLVADGGRVVFYDGGTEVAGMSLSEGTEGAGTVTFLHEAATPEAGGTVTARVFDSYGRPLPLVGQDGEGLSEDGVELRLPSARRDISGATVAVSRQKYTGRPVEPRPTVTFGGATLAEGTDYELSYENNVGAGTATVTVSGVGAFFGTVSATFEIYQDVQLIPIYRMYNTKTSEHLWTKSAKEYNSCGKGSYRDWRQENVAWYSPNLPAPSSYAKSTQGDYVYVWRLYDKGRTGDHIYLTYGNEMKQYLANGWVVDKGAGFWTFRKGAKVSGRTIIPIYRAYNPKLKRGKHHYTPSKTEYDTICKKHGWKAEDVKFYVVKK